MPSAQLGASSRPHPGFGYRWTVVALLFGVTTVNYIDRHVIGILAPTLTRELGWSESDCGAIVSWFSIAYGVGLLLTVRVIDRIGVRRGFALAVSAWSLAARGTLCVGRSQDSQSRAGFSVWAYPRISRARSRRRPSGFRRRNAHWPRASSTQGPTLASWQPRSSFPGSR